MSWNSRISDGRFQGKRIGSIFGNPYISINLFLGHVVWLNKKTLDGIETLREYRESHDRGYVSHTPHINSGLYVPSGSDYEYNNYEVELKFKNGETCIAVLPYTIKRKIERKLK
ncbi:MAG: hypothetical protein IJT70_04335 [Clostridia bacterium]|nr:hypothetical protein [Clostridia bacterium]